MEIESTQFFIPRDVFEKFNFMIRQKGANLMLTVMYPKDSSNNMTWKQVNVSKVGYEIKVIAADMLFSWIPGLLWKQPMVSVLLTDNTWLCCLYLAVEHNGEQLCIIDYAPIFFG